jgi:hypothetical protein
MPCEFKGHNLSLELACCKVLKKALQAKGKMPACPAHTEAAPLHAKADVLPASSD